MKHQILASNTYRNKNSHKGPVNCIVVSQRGQFGKAALRQWAVVFLSAIMMDTDEKTVGRTDFSRHGW